MLVDLALHVVERFLVRGAVDYDVVSAPASAEHVLPDLELKRVVQRCRNLVDVVADCRRVQDVRAEFHTLLPTSSVERFS